VGKNKWLTSGAIKLHLAALVVVCACLALGWWQLHRALYDHNQLSWAYTLEWPFFAGYAGWVWWKLLHEEPEFADPETAGSTQDGAHAGESASPGGEPRREEAGASDLEPHNGYLAGLNAAERQTPE
jgi:hypothetical protein